MHSLDVSHSRSTTVLSKIRGNELTRRSATTSSRRVGHSANQYNSTNES